MRGLCQREICGGEVLLAGEVPGLRLCVLHREGFGWDAETERHPLSFSTEHKTLLGGSQVATTDRSCSL